MKRINHNRKGQVFIISIIIAVTIALTTSFFLLEYMFKSPNPDQYLGGYQSGIIDALADGDKVGLYVDQASKMAVASAWHEYAYGNPKPNSGGDIDYSSIQYCGNYVYRLWNAIDKDCYPDYNSSKFELNTMINKNLAEITYQADTSKSDGKYRYLNNIMKNKVTYVYDYYPNESYTTIKGSGGEYYPIYAFMNSKIREDDDVLGYIDDKIALSGEGDITGIPFSSAAQGNFLPSSNREIKYLVIHYTAGYSIKDALYRFTTPGAEASAHYIIGRTNENYDIIQSVRNQDVAYHAGCDRPDYGCAKEEYKSINTNSIGIEIVNSGYLCNDVGSCKNNPTEGFCTEPYIVNGETKKSGTCWQTYPDEQYKKLVALSALLVKRYNIPIDREHIIGHVEIVQKNKVDPGPAMDMDKLVTDIQAAASQEESVLNGIVAVNSDPECMESKNDDWKITNVKLSSYSLTSDQTLKIDMTVENKGDTCVAARQELAFITMDDPLKTIFSGKSKITNVYKSTDSKPETVLEGVTCKFTSDSQAVADERIKGNCVLWIPANGSAEYTIQSKASDTNGNIKEYSNQQIKFSVKKVSKESYKIAIVAVSKPVVALSNSDRAKYDKTRNNLETLGVMDYIIEIAENDGVPVEIVLGLITQESGGDINAVSPTGAYGMFQVIKSYHENRVKKECGGWDEFKSDAKCQVRVGIGILKAYYEQYKTKGLDFNCDCSGNKGTHNCVNVNTKYTGWDAAIRAYNNAGCHEWADYNFVDTIMKYASAWGYSSTQDSIIKEELNAGIIGSYNIRPVFNTRINIDFRLFDMLGIFVNTTSQECGADGIDREKCISDNVRDFNNRLPKKFADDGVTLTTDCDDNPNSAAVNKFVEEINDCVSGGDINCQCKFTDSDMGMHTIKGKDGYSEISYYFKGENFKTYLDYDIRNDDGSLLDTKILLIKNMRIYRSDDDNAPLIYADKSTKECAVSKNKYRLCLKTPYTYPVYYPDANDEDKIQFKNIIIPFAMTVRDDIAPGPVTGLSASKFAHAKDAILLMWDKNSEQDVTRYNIYLSDDLTKFDTPTRYFRDNINHKTIGSTENNYEEYFSIDINNPICIPQTTDTGTYCLFKYRALDKEQKDIEIELKKEQLYYINSQNQFAYIMDGTIADYEFVTNTEKYLAMTAIDVDGNEIDNVKTDPDEKITQGQNLISFTPMNLLEPGLTRISDSSVENNGGLLTLSFNSIKRYIDGGSLDDADWTLFKFGIYISMGSCDTNLGETSSGQLTYTSDTNENVGVDISSMNSGDYCVAVAISTDTGLEFGKVFYESFNIPQRVI